MKTKLITIATACLCICSLLFLSNISVAQTLITDKSDYPPGSVVTLSGSGFQTNETILMQVTHNPTCCDDANSPAHQPWDVVADEAGNFTASWIIPLDGDELNASLIAVAKGYSSGYYAESFFTDHIAANLDQLQNGTSTKDPAWSHGDINGQNSRYAEGKVVPYRYSIEKLAGDAGPHFFTIKFDFTRNGVHAFDYLTKFDVTEGTAIIDVGGPCSDVESAPPTDCQTPVLVATFPDITNPSNWDNGFSWTVDDDGIGYGGAPLIGGLQLYGYNVQNVSFSNYVLDGVTTGTSDVDIIVTFTAVDANASCGFFWGAHISKGTPDAWGLGDGGASINGAPFHMHGMEFDGEGGSNEDRSMQNNAICGLTILGSSQNVSCNGSADGSIDITVSGAQGNVTFLWSDGATTEDRTGLSAGTYIVTASQDADCYASDTFVITEPDALSVNGLVTDATITGASDGSIDVTVTGGTPPYSYLWNDGVTTEDRSNLPSGNYTVTITDQHDCNTSLQFTINEPPCAIDISGTTLDVTCNGGTNGSIDVTITGAQGAVAYLWNDGITTEDRTDLVAGNYTVTATDDGACIATESFQVLQPDALEIDVIASMVTVFNGDNGSIDLTVQGGTSPYSYLWNDGVTTEDREGLRAGTYSVTVSDSHNCSAEQTVIITEPECSCTPPVIISVDSVCGNTATMCWTEVECATGYIIRWNVLPDPTWIYEFISAPTTCRTFTNHFPDVNEIEIASVCANGDTSEYSSTFTWNNYAVCLRPTDLITSNITATTAILSWTAPSDGVKYKVLYKQGSNKTTISVSTNSLTLNNLLPNTTYKWKVKSKCQYCGTNYWSDYTPIVSFKTLSQKLFALEYGNTSGIVLYPNPAIHNFNVAFNIGYVTDAQFTLEVKDLIGTSVMFERGALAGGAISENLSLPNEISAGVYFVIITANGSQFRQQLVVSKE